MTGKTCDKGVKGGKMVAVYLDIPLTGAVYSLIQDATLLWMVAQITALKPGWVRLLAGGIVGGVFQFFLLVNQSSGGLVHTWVLSPFVFTLVPFLMVGLTFYPVKLWKFLSILGNFYLLAFLLAGINWGIDALIQQRFVGWELTLWWRFLIHLTLIFILGELGWGIVHQKIWEQLCLFPIRIDWEENSLETIALLDTGNRLRDPLTRASVVIVELETIKRYLPSALLEIINKMRQGESELPLELADFWQERFRVLPFNAVGTERGLLVGFRPDRVVVRQKEGEITRTNVVIAFYTGCLSPDGTFHALIAADLIRE